MRTPRSNVMAVASVVLGSAVAAAPSLARADGALEVVPVEGGTWAGQVAAIQAAPRPPGVAFRVRVVEDDTRRALACGAYALALDEHGARGIAVGACDPRTGATDIVLVDRAALFAPGDPVPVPRAVAVSAVAVRQGASAGGAGAMGGVEVRCTASVRPYVVDLLRGVPVYLSPERYRVEPLDPGVRADASQGAWVISAARGRATVGASFRVVDPRDGHEVVRGRVALTCAADDGAAMTAVDPRAPTGTRFDPFRLPAGAVGRGSTVGGAAARLTCADAAAPAVTWRYVAPADGTYDVLLQGGYDTTLEVRPAGAAADAPSLGCSDDDGRPTHSRVTLRLRRGEAYDLVVGGYGGEAGRYELAVLRVPDDIEVRPAANGGARVVRVAPSP